MAAGIAVLAIFRYVGDAVNPIIEFVLQLARC